MLLTAPTATKQRLIRSEESIRMIPTPYWLSRCFLSTDGLVLLLLDIYHSGILFSKTLVNSLFKGPWWIHSGILSWTSLVSRGSREVLSGISFPATFYPRPHWPLGAHGTCLRALATRLDWPVRSTIHTVYSEIRYSDTGQSRSTIHIVCSGIGYSDTGQSWSTIQIVCSGIGYSDTGQSRSTIHIVFRHSVLGHWPIMVHDTYCVFRHSVLGNTGQPPSKILPVTSNSTVWSTILHCLNRHAWISGLTQWPLSTGDHRLQLTGTTKKMHWLEFLA